MSTLDTIQAKLLARTLLASTCKQWQADGLRVVFTNGVFDILHKGHITLLSKAASYGDKLVVAINADDSVRRLGKGNNRPINAEADRALLIAALVMVDAVCIFDENTPAELITLIQPDVLVKGGDYDPLQKDASAKNYMVGAAFQLQRGASAIAIPLVDGYSSTTIIEKSKNGEG